MDSSPETCSHRAGRQGDCIAISFYDAKSPWLARDDDGEGCADVVSKGGDTECGDNGDFGGMGGCYAVCDVVA